MLTKTNYEVWIQKNHKLGSSMPPVSAVAFPLPVDLLELKPANTMKLKNVCKAPDQLSLAWPS